MHQRNVIPRPEYPRPDFQRDEWSNLNGAWDFVIDPDDQGLAEEWFLPTAEAIRGTITVPFPWQSELSGVENLSHRGVAWYRRVFSVPAEWPRTVLHFGAVDYSAEVWINGQHVGSHEGGYTPFEFDITDFLVPGDNVVTVRVDDPSDLREIPHGKQSSLPANPWDDCDFTTTSGIWQTVWLEARPASYIELAHISPDVPAEQAHFAVNVIGVPGVMSDLNVEIQSPDGRMFTHTERVTGVQTVNFSVDLPDPLLWDIGVPNLYVVDLTLNTPDMAPDVVHTYFGMRSIEVSGTDVLLNGRPIYLMSALVQGYWPDGLYTAPSDDALRADIEYAKRIGLNGLRTHIKIEDPRWAYWADQLGILLWNDGPSPVLFTELARERLMRDFQGMIERDYNHPSIVVWSPYNESWGLEFRSDRAVQDHMIAIYDQIKAWDSTRLVIDNSGWRHVKTDIADSHKYTGDPMEWRGVMTLLETQPMTLQVLGHPFFALGHKYSGQPLMMSEYGNGWIDDRSWDFKWQTIEIRRHAGVAGYTYTELYDIEHEMAGFARYDRTPKDFGFDLAMLNAPDFVGFDYREKEVIHPGNTLEVPVFVSAYGLPELASGDVVWRLETVEPAPATLSEGRFDDVALTPFSVTDLTSVALAVPDAQGPVKLWVELYDDAGTLRARNYLDFEIFATQLPRTEQTVVDGETTVVNRLSLSDFSANTLLIGPMSKKVDDTWAMFEGGPTGYIEYQAPLPEGDTWNSLTVTAEIGSVPPNLVQAAEGVEGHRSDIAVSVNGVELAAWRVTDRPVNALGALMRINGIGVGQHGYWMEASAAPEQLAAIRTQAADDGVLIVRFEIKADAEYRGGMSLFGARGGRYGRDPEIRITLAK